MIECTIAGSLPKPAWLAEPEKLWAAWRLQGDGLIKGQQDAALVWIKLQEMAGIDIVSDGEQFRSHFVHGFLGAIDGIDWQRMTTMGIRNNRYDAEVPTVTEALAHSCVGDLQAHDANEESAHDVGHQHDHDAGHAEVGGS